MFEKSIYILPTDESRGTPKSFSLFITVKAITKLNLGKSDRFKTIAVVVHVLQKTQYFTLLGSLISYDGDAEGNID